MKRSQPELPLADASPDTRLDRRAALKKTAALLGGMTGASLLPEVAAAAAASSQAATDTVIARNQQPTVATGSGRVAGYVRNGINTFKGIPYGGSTAGANRFKPPVKPTPWTGVRSCRQYGYVSPQQPRASWANDEEAFMFAWDDGVQSEDCLRLNVWTPAVNDGKKRPVMVWVHGGGYSSGSGHELRSLDGENLVRRGDVVVVTLNHRLNLFGFLDLSQFGEQYASSGNAGLLDIVAALQWVRDNIAGFGGDPDSVTLFGQSGGGGKINALMAMPAAKGLFHRAIIQSGSLLKVSTREIARNMAGQVIQELGLTAATLDRIHSLTTAQLVQASGIVMRRNPRPGIVSNYRMMADWVRFAPVVDGVVLPTQPFSPTAPRLSAGMPLMVGSTLNEFVTATDHPEYEQMTVAEMEQRVTTLFGDKAQKVIAAFRERTPTAKPFDLWSRIASSNVRESAIEQATLQTANGNAPVYLYWFAWQTPIFDGRPRAFHCSEIAFVFDNTDRCETMTGGGPQARALGAMLSEAWIRFARTGNPNHPGMPDWPAVTRQSLPTMIFDNKSQVLVSPDKVEQAAIAAS